MTITITQHCSSHRPSTRRHLFRTWVCVLLAIAAIAAAYGIDRHLTAPEALSEIDYN